MATASQDILCPRQKGERENVAPGDILLHIIDQNVLHSHTNAKAGQEL